jgi:single-strand DNA-binding protein
MPNYELHVIAGHAGRAPELRYTQSGRAVADFSVAVNNPFKPDAPATWYKIICWGKTAEFVNEYVQKGTAVLVQSEELALEEWQDRDGKNRVTLALTANRVQLLGRAGERESAGPNDRRHPVTGKPAEREDMPF